MTDAFAAHAPLAAADAPGDDRNLDRAGRPAEAARPGPEAATGACACTPGEPSATALRRTLPIRNSRGLHARAAAKLVTLAERYSSCVSVSRHGQTVPACSLMGLMMLGAGKGSEIEVAAEGWDAKEALEAIAGLVEAGFHED